ncbi:MAG: RNA-binding S4 domain-containing protein [Verrucomicrobiales bacterium]|nr:RNA-binding S4 domain-containing protein [Verrucomicrobiales bacterium]
MSGRKTPESVRLDKWLWAVRLFKTRSQATDACRLNRVQVDGREAKPSRELRTGATIAVQMEDLVRTVRVTQLLEQRVGASLVPAFLEDLTPAEAYEAARQRRQQRRMAPPVAPQFKPSGRARKLIAQLYNNPVDGEP